MSKVKALTVLISVKTSLFDLYVARRLAWPGISSVGALSIPLKKMIFLLYQKSTPSLMHH